MALALVDYSQFGAAVETAELTPEVLTAANFAPTCSDAEVRQQTTNVRRSPAGISTSALQPVMSRRIAEGKVSYDLGPSGTTSAPALFSILQCTGATLSGTTLKWGDEVASSESRGKAVTFQHEDGQDVRKSVGSRATCKFALSSGAYLTAQLAFQGSFAKSSASSTSGVVPSSLAPAVGPGSALTLGGVAVLLNDFEYNIEGTLQTLKDYSKPDLAGNTIIQGLKQTARIVVFGNSTPDYETLAKNLTTGSKLSLSHVFGSVANNKLTFAGTLGIESVEPGEVQGVRTYTIQGEFLRNGANGAFTLVQS